MKKGTKTEAANENIQAVKQEGVATRLRAHVDNITHYIVNIDGHLFEAQRDWAKVGDELIAVQEEGDFAGTFEGFVKDTFGKTRDWAYKLMESSKALASLPPHIEQEIQNPRQALALSNIAPAKREKVVAGIKSSGEKMTGAALKKEAARQDKLNETVIEYDELSVQIPPEIFPEYLRAKEEATWARGLLNEISRWFRNGLGDKDKGIKRDPIFRAVAMSNERLFADIKRQVAMVDPYCVCPTCKGSTKVDGKKCQHCLGTGFLSKFEHEHAGDSEKKKDAKAPKASKIGERFAKFIHQVHGTDAIGIIWHEHDGVGSVELKDMTLLEFELKDGEFKLVETQEENLFEGG